MPNTHQEHPEDLILTGDLWVLDAIDSAADASLKIDGCPAVVFGTHPDTGEFFVGTKSVFNKRLVKINYTVEDIQRNHKQPSLQRVLSACLSYLPRVDGIHQGDFIGFGGTDTFTPNALTYKFDEVVTSHIVFAPHTEYEVDGHLSTAVAKPTTFDFVSDDNVRFIQPIVDKRRGTKVFADLNTDGINFLTTKEAAAAKVAINALIRTGQSVDPVTLTPILGDAKLAALYWLVMDRKQELMEQFIVYNSPKCFVNGAPTIGEGFVINTTGGMIKLVDRQVFSYANFNSGHGN